MDHHSHKFSVNYMVLRPEEVSFFTLFRIFWNRDIDKRAFIEYPNGKEENSRGKWLIFFFSLLFQKMLMSAAKLMSSIGSFIEQKLNLLQCNKNIFVLLYNLARDKVVQPDSKSESFMSVLGHIDKRVNLDKNIKPGDSRYLSALSAMASKISYENRAFVENTVINHWQMELFGYYDFWNDFHRKHTTQCFIFYDKNVDIVIVAFRGTEPFDADDWCTDCDLSWFEFPNMGRIHGGFMKALGLLKYKGWPPDNEIGQEYYETLRLAYYTLKSVLKQVLNESNSTKFILTGHSLGGALASIFPAVLALHEETWLLQRLEGVYTFGQPRVGDAVFKRFMEDMMNKFGFKFLRFVYSNDVVPRLPTDDSTFGFKHFGTCLYYNSCYYGKIVEEEPEKNYISLFAGIPRFFTAVWELIRSFILPHRKGSEYAEGWFLKLGRLYGLIFPGVAAHNLQDYVNVTRLGVPETLFTTLYLEHPNSGGAL